MGLFDKFKRNKEDVAIYHPSSEQEAWIGVLYACMAADGNVSGTETDMISRLIVYNELFIGYNILDLYKIAAMVCDQIGEKNLINACSGHISEDSKNTLLCYCIEILLSDGMFDKEEQEIASHIVMALGISNEDAEKIVDVMWIKNRFNREAID